MTYNEEKMSLIVPQVIEKLRKRLYTANAEGRLDETLKELSCPEFIETKMGYIKNAKILVIGYSEISEQEMRKTALELGIDDDLLDFHLDYKKNKHFDFNTLKNNVTVSDVIFGPVAHKSKGMGDTSSVICEMEKDIDSWPNVVRATNSNSLKITKKSFREALMNTRAFTIVS